MTDDKIGRLTALAQQVWPNRRRPQVVVMAHLVKIQSDLKVQEGGLASWCDLALLVHPNALDGLEAALLVLTGKDEPLAKEQAKDVWSEGFETAKRLYTKPLDRHVALEARLDQVRAWRDEYFEQISEDPLGELNGILDVEGP